MSQTSSLSSRVSVSDSKAAVPLIETAHEHILEALRKWVEKHPAPDQIALSVASLGAYSPRELWEAVENQTEVGRFLESLILFGAKRRKGSLVDVLDSFSTEYAQPPFGDGLLSETSK